MRDKIHIQEGRTTETVGSVNTTGELSAREDTWDRLVRLVVDSGVGADLQTSHCVVQNWGLTLVHDPIGIRGTYHKSDVVHVVHGEVTSREELSSIMVREEYSDCTHLLAVWVRSGVLGVAVVVLDYLVSCVARPDICLAHKSS